MHHVHTHTYMHTYTHCITYIHTYIHSHIHTHTHAHLHAYITYKHTCIPCIHSYLHTYMHILHDIFTYTIIKSLHHIALKYITSRRNAIRYMTLNVNIKDKQTNYTHTLHKQIPCTYAYTHVIASHAYAYCTHAHTTKYIHHMHSNIKYINTTRIQQLRPRMHTCAHYIHTNT